MLGIRVKFIIRLYLGTAMLISLTSLNGYISIIVSHPQSLNTEFETDLTFAEMK
jgi:hypothetical protein